MKGFYVLPFCIFIWISFCKAQSNCVSAGDEKIDKWMVTSILVDPFLMEGSSDSKAPSDGDNSATTASPGNTTESANDNVAPTEDTGNATEAGGSKAKRSADASADQSSGGTYSGFIVDLLDIITQKLGVSYEISLVPDKRYGKKEGDKWNGLIGQVCDGKAHIAAAPITVTVEREEAVDFTYSLLNIKAVAVIQERSKLEDPPINSLQALLNNSFQLGIMKESSIHRYMAQSPIELHKKANENVNKGGLEDDNEKGLRRVRAENNFAFIMEDIMANYVMKQPPCGLTAINTDLYQRQYAFAVQQRSPLRDQINSVIVDLQMDGTLDKFQKKWWGEDKCSGCDAVTHFSFVSLILTAVSILYSRFL